MGDQWAELHPLTVPNLVTEQESGWGHGFFWLWQDLRDFEDLHVAGRKSVY